MLQSYRLFLDIAYDGSDFLGWQRQASGRTVQGVIEVELSKLCGGRQVVVIGSGRTDTGVHAAGQVAHVDLTTKLPPDEVSAKLKRMVPPDIAIGHTAVVDDDFQARYSARRRSYVYSITLRRDPFRRRYSWAQPMTLDVDAMRATADALLGAHDFTALSKNNPDTANMICRVERVEIARDGEEMTIAIDADRFLYGMVRLIVGTLVDVGSGKKRREEVVTLLESRIRAERSTVAPACGLSLISVRYERALIDRFGLPERFAL